MKQHLRRFRCNLQTVISMANGNRRNHPTDQEAVRLSAEAFGQAIEERLALLDDPIDVLGREGLRLRARVAGRAAEVDLQRFYEAYLRNPVQLEAVARTLAATLREAVPPRAEQDFQALADRVYPMLKPAELLAAVRERGVPMLVYRDFLGGLIITYVIDEERSVAYINEHHLERWNISALDLHQRALENLRRRTLDQTKYVTFGEGERQVFIFNSGDGYDATRLLLTGTLAEWARRLPGNLVIGVPNRDFLIAFSDVDDDLVQAIAAQVQADSAEETTGLTGQLFTLRGGVVRLYDQE